MIGYLGAAGAAMQGLGSLVGAFGKKSKGADPEELAYQQYLYQKEFAQNGIQWRVQDAQKAGLHPLAALGSVGSSYSPVTVAGGSSSSGSSLGTALSGMGQGLSAISGVLSKEEQKEELQRQRDRQEVKDFLEYDNLAKRNALIDAQINKINNDIKMSGLPKQPSMPMITGDPRQLDGTYPIGQNSSQVNGSPARSFPVYEGVLMTLEPDGSVEMRPSQEASQGMENQEFLGVNYGRIGWDINYKFLPRFQQFLRKYAPVHKYYSRSSSSRSGNW